MLRPQKSGLAHEPSQFRSIMVLGINHTIANAAANATETCIEFVKSEEFSRIMAGLLAGMKPTFVVAANSTDISAAATAIAADAAAVTEVIVSLGPYVKFALFGVGCAGAAVAAYFLYKMYCKICEGRARSAARAAG